ncbi:MAG: EAL domain-containing protein [Actinomycetota bacterium]|nr:EAL domain-containing protein [Actinomycetota bacterium]
MPTPFSVDPVKPNGADADATDALIAREGFFTSIDQASADSKGELERRLREVEHRYRRLVDRLPAVIYIDGVGEGDPMVDVSPAIADLLGVSREEWLETYLGWERCIHPIDRERVTAESRRCVETGEPFSVEYRAIRTDGREISIREDAVLVRGEDGGALFWLGLMLDITELVQTQRNLDEAQTMYGTLVEQIPAIVYVDVADEHMSTTYVSPQIESLIGYTQQEYIDDPELWATILHPDDRDEALEAYLRGRQSGEPFVFEYRLMARDGRIVWFSDSAIVLPDAEGRPHLIQGVMLDITERKDAEARIAFLAYHDKLTGLPNRAMFDELLELSLARARRNDVGVAVIAVDIDDFKLVNESLGYEAGDALIVALTERLREATRETDLVARTGGDEFLLLLADLDQNPMPGAGDGASTAAEAVAVRVQQSLAAPFEIVGTELYLTASMGISVFPRDAETGGELLKNADMAMFQSKKAGPGGFVMHAAKGADALVRLSLSTRLRKAVDQRSWTLHYQPVIELDTGRMVGVEALIRWPDPKGGLVPPGEFIPLAEEMGLIEAIGDWVIEEICRQDAIWRAAGLTIDIGFNLSPRQLWQADLVAKIVEPLIASGIDPTRVTVEITESTAMTDPDRTLGILTAIHDSGVRLALDDFGTGYSSLARLRHMPVDVLKIDRIFVRDVDMDPQNASMVSAMIALASNLGMTSLAEGIETESEWNFLADRGCTLGQGFWFSRPVPADEILATWRRTSLHVVEGGART